MIEAPPTKQGERMTRERAAFLLQWVSDKTRGGIGPTPAELYFLIERYIETEFHDGV